MQEVVKEMSTQTEQKSSKMLFSIGERNVISHRCINEDNNSIQGRLKSISKLDQADQI